MTTGTRKIFLITGDAETARVDYVPLGVPAFGTALRVGVAR